MMKLLKQILDSGGPGYVQFAITNLCNAKCNFCGFSAGKLKPNEIRLVSLQDAIKVINISADNGIGYMLFVGGEPLLHKDLLEMVKYCSKKGIRPMICTHGSLWTRENVKEFIQAGLTSVIMSIDAPDIAVHEKNRGLPGVCDTIKMANSIFHSHGVETVASITASKLIEDYTKLPAFLESLGFDRCTFSYPLTNLPSSYLSFSDSNLVSYSQKELYEVFQKIIDLKSANSGVHVLNPMESLKDMQRHIRGEKENFECLAGFKYFYVDWNLDIYRCHAWPTPICKIDQFNRNLYIRDGCTKCMIDCYRDPSVLHYAAITISDSWHLLKSGSPFKAVKLLADKKFFLSLRTIWKERKWIGTVGTNDK